jgi:hypothetical protein
VYRRRPFEHPKQRLRYSLLDIHSLNTYHVPCTENDSEVLVLGVELLQQGPGVLLLGLRRLRSVASAVYRLLSSTAQT